MLGVHDQQHHLGEGDGFQAVLHRQPLELLLDLGLPAHARRVDQAHALAVPFPVDGNGVAGDAGFRAGEQAVLADQAVDQGRLSGVGPADHGDADGLVGAGGLVVVVALGRGLEHCGIELRHALTVGGADLQRLAEAQGVGLQRTGLAGLALGLVGQDDHRLAAAPQGLGEDVVELGHPLARVEHEEAEFGLLDGLLGLGLHPRGEALVGDVLESGGVDQLQVQVAEAPGPVAAVAGDPRPVIDDGQRPARKPVE